MKCDCSGKDRDDGYPVCKHANSYKHTDNETHFTQDDIEDDLYPPLYSMRTCPLNLWMFSGNKRIPKKQSLLVEFEKVRP